MSERGALCGPIIRCLFVAECQRHGVGEWHIGGSWVIRVPAYNDVTFGASLKGSFWLSIDGLDHPTLMEEGDCYFVANHLGYRRSSERYMGAVDPRCTLARSLIWPTEVVTRHVAGAMPADHCTDDVCNADGL
jgi:hypothetical protein